MISGKASACAEKKSNPRIASCGKDTFITHSSKIILCNFKIQVSCTQNNFDIKSMTLILNNVEKTSLTLLLITHLLTLG